MHFRGIFYASHFLLGRKPETSGKSSYVPTRITTIVDCRSEPDPDNRSDEGNFLKQFSPSYFGNCTIPIVSSVLDRDVTRVSLRTLALLSRSSISTAPRAFRAASEAMYHLQRQTRGKCLSALLPLAPVTDFTIDSWVKMRRGLLHPGFGKVLGFTSIPESPPLEWASIWFPHQQGVRVVLSVPKGMGLELIEIVGRS